MVKSLFFLFVLTYCTYSFFIYTYCSQSTSQPTQQAKNGMDIWQGKNCQSCHQIYGLGGYLGPDLTNIISNPTKGPLLAEVFIKNGSARMPNFHLTDRETKDLLAFLTWVDKSGSSTVPVEKVTWYGNYKLDK